MAEKLLMLVKKRKESGVSMLEYGLLAALVAVAAIAGMQALGSSADTTFSNVAGSMAT